MRKTKSFILKSNTNDNEICKQRFFIAGNPDNIQMEDALIIYKRVLTEKYEDYYRKYDFQKIKSFKGKVLCEQVFSIKISSINKAIDFFNQL